MIQQMVMNWWGGWEKAPQRSEVLQQWNEHKQWCPGPKSKKQRSGLLTVEASESQSRADGRFMVYSPETESGSLLKQISINMTRRANRLEGAGRFERHRRSTMLWQGAFTKEEFAVLYINYREHVRRISCLKVHPSITTKNTFIFCWKTDKVI